MTIDIAKLSSIEGLGAQGSGLGGVQRLLTSNPEPKPPAALGGRDTPDLRKAFTEFAGQTFFGELLKQMRATVDKPAYMHGGMGEDIFQSQLDQVLVERMANASAATFTDPMYQLLMARRT